MKGILRGVVVIFMVAVLAEVGETGRHLRSNWRPKVEGGNYDYSYSYCLSWRLAAETNDIRGWRTVPSECLRHVQSYMLLGQYDAWILDVDDTCLSNIMYYKLRQFGCEPYDPQGFKMWASKGGSPAIPATLRLFNKLVEAGFKVILITGRDEETLYQATSDNLHNQGFIGYERLILRSAANKGQGGVVYKSEKRKQLVEEGYRIWGNVGDQWSDLQGDFIGNRTFKLPNPMYFVP
ncbi:acid phosphatase 1 isoform X2 [Apium graveolens]|uniref:acid phosphatase 1 isoform X2 n=1 Tax=Apium graveolens TaxID=4045 RepID=UPI003D78B94E